MTWLDGERASAQSLILDTLLPLAHEALSDLGLDSGDIDTYLSTIEKRVANKRNGAQWQRDFVERYGCDMTKLCEDYYDNQETGLPVHTWSL